MNISCSVDLSYHSPVVWWNSQSSCVGLLPRSSQTGGKGSWTSRNTAQKSRYRGRCHSPNPGSNLKKKGKRKSDSRRHISFKIVWDFLMCQYAHGQIKESEILLTSEEAFLGVDEMVRGLVHLNLTLPRLGHVPYPGVAGYHVELKNKKNGKDKTNFNLWGTLCVCNTGVCFGSALLECWRKCNNFRESLQNVKWKASLLIACYLQPTSQPPEGSCTACCWWCPHEAADLWWWESILKAKAIIFQKLDLRLSSWKHCYLPKLLMLTSGNRGEHWHNFICSVWQIVTSQKLWVLSRWDKGLAVEEFYNVALVHCHSFMQFFSRAEVWTLTGPLQPWFFSFLTCSFTTVVGMTVLLHDPAVWWPHIWL